MRTTWIKIIIGTILISGCGDGNKAADTPKTDTQDKIVSAKQLMPPSEIRFIDTVNAYAEKYNRAENELLKSATWKERRNALSQAASRRDNEKKAPWIGILETMGTTSDGHAFISVRIAKNITISTHTTDLFGDTGHTLIKSGTKNYTILSQLKPGAMIAFLAAIDLDGSAVTEQGKMIEPVFIARFVEITPK